MVSPNANIKKKKTLWIFLHGVFPPQKSIHFPELTSLTTCCQKMEILRSNCMSCPGAEWCECTFVSAREGKLANSDIWKGWFPGGKVGHVSTWHWPTFPANWPKGACPITRNTANRGRVLAQTAQLPATTLVDVCAPLSAFLFAKPFYINVDPDWHTLSHNFQNNQVLTSSSTSYRPASSGILFAGDHKADRDEQISVDMCGTSGIDCYR